MAITKLVSSEQMQNLGLHQGDSLRVLAETGGTFLIEIVKAAQPPTQTLKGRAGEWARKYAGAASGPDSETTDDVRMAHVQEKYGF